MRSTGAEKKKSGSQDWAFEILHILSDPNRLRILRILAENTELCARDILLHFPITQPTLSHHMNVLLESRMVEARKSGRWVFYRISPDCLKEMIGFFEGLLQDVSTNREETVTVPPVRQNVRRAVKPSSHPEKEALDIISKIHSEDREAKSTAAEETNIVDVSVKNFPTEDSSEKKKKNKDKEEKKKDKKKKKNKKK